MKIGVLTFCYTVNYGAELQAFALVKSLNKLNGVQAELIDYKNSAIYNSNSPKSWNDGHGLLQKIRYAFAWSAAKKRWDKFRSFEKRYIPLSDEYYSEQKGINEEKYDHFLIGSDQIWNLEITGNDLNFFLSSVTEKEKIYTYAASFGYSTVPEQFVEVTRDELMKIKNLTVRENRGADIIYDLCKKTAEVVVDPTLLLCSDEWKKMLISCPSIYKANKPYILLYLINPEDEYIWKFLLRHADEHNLDILWITPRRYLDKPGKKIRSAGPLDFLSLIYSARLVVTGSFHAVCFSLQFSKNFLYVIKDKNKASRVIGLIEQLGISEVLFQKEQIEVPILNYETVQGKIEELRQNSLKYLNSFCE